MNIGWPAAVHGVADGRMLGKLVLQIHDRPGAADEQDGIPVVQAAHFIRGEQLPAAHLEVGGVGTGAAFRLAVGPGINGGLAQRLGDVLVGAGLVAAQVEDGVRVAGDGLPAILVQLLDLGHVLDDGTGRDVAGAHGGQLAGEAGQGHRGELVQHEVDMAGQGPVVDLVGAVVEGLERLGVEQGHQEIECRVIVRDDGVQRHFLFAQGVEVHVVVVGDGLDLGQIEGSQPDGGGHEDGLGGLARNKLSRTFYQKISNRIICCTLLVVYVIWLYN